MAGSPWHRFWLTVGWIGIGLAVWFSLIPNPHLPAFHRYDKLYHIGGYGLLTLWLGQLWSGLRPRLALWLALALLGGGLEVAQALGGSRLGDWRDALANIAGITVGLLLLWTPLGRVLAIIERRLRPPPPPAE